MMRTYVVCYDIREPKRLRRVCKIMKGYGERRQFSVFLCVLKEIDLVRMQAALDKVLNMKEDQVMIIDLGQNAENAKSAITIIGQVISREKQDKIIII
jgi:CRISPR-associated protein Cas2